MTIEPGTAVCCSWSGGKDSCLALHRALTAGAKLIALVTMFTEDGQRSRSHGLPRQLIEAQAAQLGVPLLAGSATWENYEIAFIDLLREARQRGVGAAVFGDIDIARHREWEEQVCRHAGLGALLPLWQQERRALLQEWWSSGFEARIVVVRNEVLGVKFLGQTLDRAVAAELVEAGIDACGENGEFHTLVTGGPLFPQPLVFEWRGQVLRDGCWFQDVAVRVE